jgi:hypothetical protein
MNFGLEKDRSPFRPNTKHCDDYTECDRPIAHQERSPFIISDGRDPNNHRPVSGISPPTTTKPTPQRVAAWAKRLSSVAIGNSNRSANSK